MRITVFGATGAIGQLVVERLLARGDDVTAYLRSPDKVPPVWSGAVRTAVGELAHHTLLRAAVDGADAVISCLGPVPQDKHASAAPLIAGTRAVVEAMTAAGVQRYLGLGTPSARDPRDRRLSAAALPVALVRLSLPEAYAAVVGMSAAVRDSPLDWTIARFLLLTDGPARGVRRAGYVGHGVGARITRADVADFLVDQLGSTRWSRAMPQISN